MIGSSDLAIEYHNHRMETDEEYAGEFQRHEEEAAYHYQFLMAQADRYLNHFPDYRLDHTGYEEFDELGLDVETVGQFDDDDLPW
ncbi:MAG TPA: hypothetical protein PKY82_02605 [Pyrinomonadaceae bacterium]|nr:hypothetical protein [Pyrinomonadaceae bacterium]